MPHLQLVSDQEAHGDVVRIFAEIKEALGLPFVPNFFRTLANSLTAIRTTWEAYRSISLRGNVPTVLKEMMFVAIAAERKCHYCEIAHLALCKLLGCDPQTRRSLVQNLDTLAPRRTADVIKFAVKAALKPADIGAGDYRRLRQHDFSDAEVTEILAMASFALYATTLADAFQLSVDPEFEQILASA
jgi:uncharacterized peroxidase-related enzyme